MQSLKVLATKIDEVQAMELIFDACRANAERKPVDLPGGRRVIFLLRADGCHDAVLTMADGTRIAHATVDEFDC